MCGFAQAPPINLEIRCFGKTYCVSLSPGEYTSSKLRSIAEERCRLRSGTFTLQRGGKLLDEDSLVSIQKEADPLDPNSIVVSCPIPGGVRRGVVEDSDDGAGSSGDALTGEEMEMLSNVSDAVLAQAVVDGEDPYELLSLSGVPIDATSDVAAIKRAYLKLAAKVHPDKLEWERATAAFQKLQKACGACIMSIRVRSAEDVYALLSLSGATIDEESSCDDIDAAYERVKAVLDPDSLQSDATADALKVLQGAYSILGLLHAEDGYALLSYSGNDIDDSSISGELRFVDMRSVI